MKKLITLILALILFIFPVLTKDKKVVFDEQLTWSYIADLASDAMAGRKSGQPGAVMAENYIAEKFRKWGLSPAGDNNSFFQEFTIEYRNIGQGLQFEVFTDKERKEFDYRADWSISRYSGSGHFTAEIVYVGYGIHAPEQKYDEYSDVDVRGKIVLLSTDTPSKWRKKEEGKMENRLKAAREKGALGVIGFKSTRDQSRYVYLPVKKENYKSDFVILTVQERIPTFLFKELKTELRYLTSQLAKGKPLSFNTGVKAHISVNAIYDPKRSTRNVLAKIEGSDPLLKNECVVIGGHMDHMGISPDGEVYNGANDNASGTAVVMEIARIMKLNNIKPKRTVIFGLWAGEEQGLLGSKYYCDHPLIPMDKTAAYLNMDMVSHGNGNVPFAGTYYGPKIWEVIKEKLPKKILEYIKPGRGGPGGSDHSPFLAKGVPGYAIMTEGHHYKYHRVRDDSDLVKPEILKKVGDFVYEAVQILGDAPELITTTMRQENYEFKYQNMNNFTPVALDKLIADYGDKKDSPVNLQLAYFPVDKELKGDALRIKLINDLFDVSKKFSKSKGLGYYANSGSLYMNPRQGKTTVMVGLNGIEAFRDNPKWAGILAKQGIAYAFCNDPSFLFEKEGLSEEGKKFVKEVSSSGLLFYYKGLDDKKAKILLEKSKRPFILVRNTLPSEDVLNLIKKKNAALGLVMKSDEKPSDYFAKLDSAKKVIESRLLLPMMESSLRTEAAKTQMLSLFSEMIKAGYKSRDFSSLFRNSFMSVMSAAKGPRQSQMVTGRRF